MHFRNQLRWRSMSAPVFAQPGIVVRSVRPNATCASGGRLGFRVARAEPSPECDVWRGAVHHEQCFTALRSALLLLALGPIEALANRKIGEGVPLTDSSRLPPRRGIMNEALEARIGCHRTKQSRECYRTPRCQPREVRQEHFQWPRGHRQNDRSRFDRGTLTSEIQLYADRAVWEGQW